MVSVGFSRVIFLSFEVWKLVVATYKGNEEKKLKIHKAVCNREDYSEIFTVSYTVKK